MRRAQIKQNIKQKEQRKTKPGYHTRQCPVCKYEFKTKHYNKKYCTKKCVRRRHSFNRQIPNTEKYIIKIEEKILNINKKTEEKINKIVGFADKKNSDLEKLRIECVKKLDFMRSVL